MRQPLKSAILASVIAFLVCPAVTFGQLRTVKVGTTSKLVVDNLPMFVGIHMKYFEEEGLKLEPSYLRGGGETVRAMTTRSVEFNASTAAGPILIAIDKGEPIKIVSGQVAGIVGVYWAVEASSPLRSIKDLKGKKVGFSTPGSLTHLTLEYILKKEGLDKDVQMVRTGTAADSWTAVRNKVVDVGWNVLPAVHSLILKNEARILFRGDDYVKEYQQAVVPVMEDVLKKDPELIRKFLRARAKAVRFLRENPERTIAIWAQELERPVAAIRLAYKDLHVEAFETGAPRMENLRGALQEALDVGAIKQPLDLAKTLDLRFLPQ